MMTDPISDCFSRLRNGAKARQEYVEVPHSKMKEEILQVLKTRGFVQELNIVDGADKRKNIVVKMKYDHNGDAVLEHIKRVSKPGHRIYGRADKPTKVREGLGFQIISTSKGIMTDTDAREKKVGGEVLAEVW